MDIINVKYLEKAPTVFHGCTVENEDGSYTILLDPNDSAERQKEALEHELEHIMKGDLQKEDVQQIEAEAHHMAQPAYDAAESNAADKAERERQRVLRSLRRKRKKIQRWLAEYEEYRKLRQDIEWTNRKRSWWGK